MFKLTTVVTSVWASLCLQQQLALANDLPVVDLGYALYKPTTSNDTGRYYNFSNIRYAAPPLGNLRFNAPQPPLNERSLGVQDGSKANICPQSAPASWDWTNANIPKGEVIPVANSTLPESEDCLLLDVVVPHRVFGAKKGNKGKPAPVMVNIHGGGFFIGDKATLYPPQDLIKQSDDGIIFVSMNYRLTAFGFLGGLFDSPTNKTSTNAGLLDQREALKWVQKYIHLFGGDPKQVTIYGESGGGASVMFHAIGYGGKKETDLFQRVVGQSPGPKVTTTKAKKAAAEAFLAELNVTSVDEVRKLPTEDLIKANAKVQLMLSGHQPIVDGDLVPGLPSRLYVEGQTVKNLDVLSAHNSDEARLFVPPSSDTQAAFDGFIKFQFPDASKDQIAYINNTLYPYPPDPNSPYQSQFERLSLLDADVYNLCWTVLLSATFTIASKHAHNFIFGVEPGYHAQDLAYTFYNGEPFQKDVNVTVATAIQKGVANFVLTGNPNGKGVKVSKRGGRAPMQLFPDWNANLQSVIEGGSVAVKKAPLVKFTGQGYSQGNEDAAGRCGWFFETAFANSN